MRSHPLLAAVLAFACGAACCADPAPRRAAPTKVGETPKPALSGCRLPAPQKSQDACTTDADCGPSEPCHAKECVARARSKPRTPDTVCTEIFECGTTDANRCGCFEGRCSLIPPGT
jgi:hypothetical protein